MKRLDPLSVLTVKETGAILSIYTIHTLYLGIFYYCFLLSNIQLSIIYSVNTTTNYLVSPASLLDSQHGCIASPHAKKESGQTP